MDKIYCYDDNHIKLARKRFLPLLFTIPAIMALILRFIYTTFDTELFLINLISYSMVLLIEIVLITIFIRKSESKFRNTKLVLTNSSLDTFVKESIEQSIPFSDFQKLVISNTKKGELHHFRIQSSKKKSILIWRIVEMHDMLERIKEKFSESQITTRVI